MNEKILCVDDEPNILEAYRRTLRKRFELDVACGGEEALQAIAQRGPYAVLVADMRMPGMNGVELLAKVRQIAPLTVRMMLTGNTDLQTAIDAVNQGHIFRFLTKPCSPEDFANALEAGLEQHRLLTAERQLLTQLTYPQFLASRRRASSKAVRACEDVSCNRPIIFRPMKNRPQAPG